MINRKAASLKVVPDEIEASEAAIAEASKQSAPMVQRLASHRNRIDLALKDLESERFDLISRRDLLRRQAEAVEAGLNMHIEDIEATMRLYEGGLNGLPAQEEGPWLSPKLFSRRSVLNVSTKTHIDEQRRGCQPSVSGKDAPQKFQILLRSAVIVGHAFLPQTRSGGFFHARQPGATRRTPVALKAVLDSLDSVDAAFHDHYTETDGKFYLQIEGIKDHPDTQALRSALERVSSLLPEAFQLKKWKAPGSEAAAFLVVSESCLLAAYQAPRALFTVCY